MNQLSPSITISSGIESYMDFIDTPVTVAFTLEALERVQDPESVFEQTSGWATSVGIVSDRPMHAQTSFARTNGLDYGFHSGPRSLRESLPVIGSRPEQAADRYLLIGTQGDEAAVRGMPWEFLTVEEAADAAGWILKSEDSTSQGWP